MRDKAKAMVLGSLAGDSLALGVHWIYDTNQIDEQVGRVDRLLKPLPDSYHKEKNKGAFTHYGDQTVTLLESIARNQGFVLQGFAEDWQRLFSSYTGYVDKATTQTLQNFRAGASPENSGSGSSDLGGAARIAPLAYLYREQPDVLLDSAVAQTRMTHAAPAAVAAAEFLARVTYSVLHGIIPTAAIEDALDAGVADMDLDMRIRGALTITSVDSREVIAGLGQMCGAANALPAAVHLIVTHEHDLEKALIENAMAGGDSAARGLATGMVLGAHLGMDAIPEHWLTEMEQYEHCVDLLRQIP